MKLLLALLLTSTLARAGPTQPTVDVRPGSSNISIGEKFSVTVDVHGPAGTTYEFPQETGDGSVDLVLPEAANRRAQTAVYEARVFALGAEARIPAIAIRYTLPDGTAGSLRSLPVPLNVISTLDPKDPNPAPADFAPPVPVQVSRAFWVASAIAGSLSILLLVAIARRLRDPRKAIDPTVTVPISPEEDAFKALDDLSVSGRAYGDARTFYIPLIQIMKRYLERRLQAPVLEMTSAETLSFVRAHAWTAPHVAGIRDLATSADLVKFGGSTDASNAERQLQLVRDLVGRVDRLRRAELERETRAVEQRKTA